MKDIAKQIKINGAKLPMIKGHTRIELTKVATGEKKIIEHDNLFQSSVLEKYMRSMGAYNNSPFANSTWAGRQIWRNLCGGIFLFRDAISDPVEYMPAGNKMIANGAVGVSNTGTPIELGSYNSIESSTGGSSSLTFVYDWGTSQGNGTISCICLTSEIGGFVGYGNPSGISAASRIALNANQESTNDNNGIPYKNKLYSFSRNGTAKKITVTKRSKAISEVSLFNGQNTETVEISYTSSLVGNNGIDANYVGNGKFVLFPWIDNTLDNTVAVNGTYKFLIYDAETDTIAEKTVTNISENTWRVADHGTASPLSYCKLIGNLFIAPTAVDIAVTGLPLNIVDIDAGTVDYITANAAYNNYNYTLVPDIVGVQTDNGALWVYDSESQTFYPTNANTGVFIYNDQLDAMFTNRINGGSVYKNPLFLATINNLETAITKDNTQTMKVIYTLTEA